MAGHVAGITILGLTVSTIASWPTIHRVQTASAHKAVVMQRISSCKFLPPGETIKEGFNYAARVDPAKTIDAKTKKPTLEGELLNDGDLLCSFSGWSAQTSNAAAQNLRQMSASEMKAEIMKRFPDGKIPLESMAIVSRRYVPDFKARAAEKEKAEKADPNKINIPN